MQKLTRLADEKLVAAYASGNNEAFDTLLRRHENRVFNYIFNIVKNKDVADDIFQETFVKAISTIKQGRYTDSGKFSAWITRIAHNLIIDFFRQAKSENTISTDQEDADVLNRRDLSEENVEDLMVTSQIHTDVKRIMESLPSRSARCLTCGSTATCRSRKSPRPPESPSTPPSVACATPSSTCAASPLTKTSC